MDLFNNHSCCNCRVKIKNFCSVQKIIELLKMIEHSIFINV